MPITIELRTGRGGHLSQQWTAVISHKKEIFVDFTLEQQMNCTGLLLVVALCIRPSSTTNQNIFVINSVSKSDRLDDAFAEQVRNNYGEDKKEPGSNPHIDERVFDNVEHFYSISKHHIEIENLIFQSRLFWFFKKNLNLYQYKIQFSCPVDPFIIKLTLKLPYFHVVNFSSECICALIHSMLMLLPFFSLFITYMI